MKIEFTRGKMCYKMCAFFEQARYPNSFAACPTNQVTPHVNQLKLQHRRRSASSAIMRDVLNSLTLHMPLIWVGVTQACTYIYPSVRTLYIRTHTHTYIKYTQVFWAYHCQHTWPGFSLIHSAACCCWCRSWCSWWWWGCGWWACWWWWLDGDKNDAAACPSFRIFFDRFKCCFCQRIASLWYSPSPGRASSCHVLN